MNMRLNLSDKEVVLLNTALISQINHYQTIVDDYRKEMGSPDCAEYLDDLKDLEKRDSGRKRDYEKLRSKIKTQILWEALRNFGSEKTECFRRVGSCGRLYLLHVGGNLKETFAGIKDSLNRHT